MRNLLVPDEHAPSGSAGRRWAVNRQQTGTASRVAGDAQPRAPVVK
jgi:hypothetical protein